MQNAVLLSEFIMAKKPSESEKPDTNPDVTKPQNLPFRVMTQFLQDFSFENPGALFVQSGTAKGRPHYNANWHITNKPIEAKNPDDKTEAAANLYQAEVRITLSAHYDGKDDKKIPCFMLEVAYSAVVEIAFNLTDKKVHQQILRIDIPRLLYPYLRHEIDKVMQAGGYPAMTIPPLNFVAAYEQFLKQDSSNKSD